MPKTTTIPLDAPGLQGHDGKRIMRVVVREPYYDEYLDIGEPRVYAISPSSGIPFWIEDKQAIASYARKLIVEPEDPLLLSQGGLQLAIKVREAILGFFSRAGEAAGDTKT